LKPFISHYGCARVWGLTPGVNTTLPSSHAHLIISLGAPINVRQMSNQRQPGASFSALVTRLHDGFATIERGSAWARFAILDEVFTRSLTPAKGSPLVAHAWRQLAASHGRRSIESLAQESGWSRRYMADRFRAELGVTPKTAARIFRFGRACGLLSYVRQPLADIAAACGYADQAHMTRDWSAFTGTSPKDWILSELPFLQDYELPSGDAAVGASGCP
jgi:AraC-like DNA-binding protein